MISEVAHIKVLAGHEAQFEAAVAEAVQVFAQAEGCLGLHLQRSIENPAEYEAIIRWNKVEDHTVGFREGPLFQQWRALVGPHFDGAPVVQHYAVVMERVDF